MNNLTLEEVRTGLQDLLFGSRRSKLDLLAVASTYIPDLERLLQGIVDLSPELRGIPQAQLLATVDGRRDEYLRLIRQLGEMIAGSSTCSAKTQETASRMVETFVANQSGHDPYALAAAKAETLQKPRDEMHDALAKIPTPDGRTAAAWVDDFLLLAVDR
ncbi:MAG: hypothetical protein AUK47_12165 [Deltaproteobacteria bacterium CG2_30_63_29]|nr:MAG: hypothetical protein AUK47_12165 [Deltaproteobacteria bacterium CG2_30_63_29]PJB36084.1 MAG: hypothetical protein CO108_24225 [Deltaproteobacteria bacterium CG_4_9_14_3_um_filter_63_12]